MNSKRTKDAYCAIEKNRTNWLGRGRQHQTIVLLQCLFPLLKPLSCSEADLANRICISLAHKHGSFEVKRFSHHHLVYHTITSFPLCNGKLGDVASNPIEIIPLIGETCRGIQGGRCGNSVGSEETY